MAITFQKRQKEMKRLEKQRLKEERRAEKKLERRAKAQGTFESALTEVGAPEAKLIDVSPAKKTDPST
jgi:hypothetical protein